MDLIRRGRREKINGDVHNFLFSIVFIWAKLTKIFISYLMITLILGLELKVDFETPPNRTIQSVTKNKELIFHILYLFELATLKRLLNVE